ncbi:hypothetical protein EIN_046840 [Entamoeba invadens IP1]|uniref:F-box domain-containing protein n=1 Tax=Entamoeba invadens IP1 TaxID=370355 RepID=A0A0A1UDK7_ENTIV|nr:hypothetical protein EIN_046840 [Entamoeba invadens IP1]ELP94421.1 hypothetical protein EIN_046840 [Entamoeba invadens IP1]|eukprot:XP_004261192.1 hypothetical protein EIN_046840 [Entamoeba invadens IP1]
MSLNEIDLTNSQGIELDGEPQFADHENPTVNVLESISDDSIFTITQYLTPEDLINFSQTNRRVWYICKRDEVWTSLVLSSTGRVTYTKRDAIRSLIDKKQEDNDQENTRIEFRKMERQNKLEHMLFTMRDCCNFISNDLIAILFGIFGLVLLQVELDGYVNVGYWLVVLLFLPLLIVLTIVPMTNFCTGKLTDDDEPPVRWYSSPIETIRYLYIFGRRGAGILTEPCLVINYVILFAISLGLSYLVIIPPLLIWTLIWIFFGCFTFSRRPIVSVQIWRGLLAIPVGIVVFIGIILVVVKIEDVIDVSFHIIFIPFYFLLGVIFIFPMVSFFVFCGLCLCGKSYDTDSCCNKICWLDVTNSDLAALQSLFVMLVISIVCPFTMTFIALLATNFDGSDDVSYFVTFIPIDILVIFLIILYGVGKRYELTRL